MKVSIAIVASILFGIGLGMMGERDNYNTLLTKGVALERVPIKGQVSFDARILISYKDGKLASVELVPKTTIMLPPPPPSSPK